MIRSVRQWPRFDLVILYICIWIWAYDRKQQRRARNGLRHSKNGAAKGMCRTENFGSDINRLGPPVDVCLLCFNVDVTAFIFTAIFIHHVPLDSMLKEYADM